MHKLLVNSEAIGDENVRRLSRYAQVVEAWKLDGAAIQRVLPEVDAAIVFSWPSYFSGENLARMGMLKFIQTVMVGVNHVPFGDLRRSVVVCNNSGAFSVEVGEHAWGLLLAAAKKIVQTDAAIRGGGRTIDSFRGEEKDILVLRGKEMGIVGFGGIGRAVARYARAFGMPVVAFNRSRKKETEVRFLYGRKGLEQLLKASDAILISIPLTKSTERLIGKRELEMMKEDAVLVNVARGDIVDQAALYERMSTKPSFRYATDAWWFKEGNETLETENPFASLPNFVGTPHTSGPTGLAGGGPQLEATENAIRFLRGLAPRNVVKRSDFL